MFKNKIGKCYFKKSSVQEYKKKHEEGTHIGTMTSIPPMSSEVRLLPDSLADLTVISA